jgi:hypothetical protein
MKRFLKMIGLCLSCLILAWVSSMTAKIASEKAQLDDEFKSVGAQTKADLVGYEYVVVKGKNGYQLTGDRPVLAYKTKDSNVSYRYVAYEYGLVSSYGKKNLPNQEIVITYLPKKPWVARVEAWHSSQASLNKIVSVISAWLSFVSIILVYQMLRVKPLTAHEDS